MRSCAHRFAYRKDQADTTDKHIASGTHMSAQQPESRFQQVLNWFGEHEFSTLARILVLAAGLWGFAAITDEVLEGETESVDRSLLMSLRTPGDPSDPLGPLWWRNGAVISLHWGASAC